MATSIELHDLAISPGPTAADTQKKVLASVMNAAQGFLADVNATTDEKSWAAGAVSTPARLTAEARRVWPLVLAANSGASVAAIESASDSLVQTSVDAVVTQIAAGLASGGQ